MVTTKDSVVTLTDEMCAVWQARESMDSVLSRFVIKTASRASGCWRLEDGVLQLAGFGGANDMPNEVSHGFQAATSRVPLDQTGLGIVKAVIARQPVIGRRDSLRTGLDGSATWITRFDANSSLAVAIHGLEGNSILGVIAISTAAIVEEGDVLWQTMIQLASELGKWSRPNR